MEYLKSPFALRLREIRKQRGITQAKLAEISGSAPQTISAYETGRIEPSAFSVVCLCDALDVSADYLLGRTKTV